MAKYLLLHNPRGQLVIVKRKQISVVTPDYRGVTCGAVLTNIFDEDIPVQETVAEISVLLASDSPVASAD